MSYHLTFLLWVILPNLRVQKNFQIVSCTSLIHTKMNSQALSVVSLLLRCSLYALFVALLTLLESTKRSIYVVVGLPFSNALPVDVRFFALCLFASIMGSSSSRTIDDCFCQAAELDDFCEHHSTIALTSY